MFNTLYKKHHQVWKNKYSMGLKRKRLEFVNQRVLEGQLFNPSWLKHKKIMELGCNTGKDFLQFFALNNELALTAIDIDEYKINQENCTFLQCDAEKLPFDDQYFDFVISVGVLEHIEPIEKLCKVISELDRVSKSFAVIVPNISTIVEPHTTGLFWPLRATHKKSTHRRLNYFSDEAWMQFEGFRHASLTRFSYIFPLITNTLIYKKP